MQGSKVCTNDVMLTCAAAPSEVWFSNACAQVWCTTITLPYHYQFFACQHKQPTDHSEQPQYTANLCASLSHLSFAGADTTVALQYGYDYDVTNGVTPYSASQTNQHMHKPIVKVPAGATPQLYTSAGL